MIKCANVKRKDLIRFRTINEYDTQEYEGWVLGICGYDMALTVSDVANYHAEVKKTTPKIKDVELLEYFIIKNKVDDKVTAIAVEWIEPSSLVIIDIPTEKILRLFNTTTEHAKEAVRLLSDNGFEVVLKTEVN